MKEALSLLCKTGSGLAHAYVKLEVKDRCLYGGDQKRPEVAGSNFLSHPLSWVPQLGVRISLTLASGREG